MTRPRPPAHPDTRQARGRDISGLWWHPLFDPLLGRLSNWVDIVSTSQSDRSLCPPNGWTLATSDDVLHIHPTRRADPQEWDWMVGHSLLHFAFEHTEEPTTDVALAAARCAVVNRFLVALKVGRPPYGLPELPPGDEATLAERIRQGGTGVDLASVSSTGGFDVIARPRVRTARPDTRWSEVFAHALGEAVHTALEVAGGEIRDLRARRVTRTPWQAALSWFVTAHPLLGALAAGFRIEEQAHVCRAAGVDIAGVSPSTGVLYLNADASLSPDERRFVVAHELLHAGLRHDTRHGGRDPWFWNVACDFVINDWLVQMGVGQLPEGALYDPMLRGLSAEAVYDLVAAAPRRYRSVSTFAGAGTCDIAPGRLHDGTCPVDTDAFYRRALQQGLASSIAAGTLPAGLEQEIRALAHPPIPWDVELARWFEVQFPPRERVRSYQRSSRRQSSTPDIPRPAVVEPRTADPHRTFGVVLDTSGSMTTALLARALGAVASYARRHDVSVVRVVFCDAVAYDAGWLAVDDIARAVRVRGRGGTLLQPGVDLLERAEDFPVDGPILVITDGTCDRFQVRREHALLVPAAARLPFVPRGPVFRMTPPANGAPS